MNKLFPSPFADVRKIVVYGVICMLFFAAVSCESVENLEEYEEEECLYEPTEQEILEVFTSRFSISGSMRYENSRVRYIMFDMIPPSSDIVEPINLPEDFRRFVRVQAVVGRIGENTNEYGEPLVKIIDIQETDIRDGRFFVRWSDRWERYTLCPRRGNEHPMLPLYSRIPTNLSTEFQVEGLYVQVAYRHTGDGNAIVEIVEIAKVE